MFPLNSMKMTNQAYEHGFSSGIGNERSHARAVHSILAGLHVHALLSFYLVWNAVALLDFVHMYTYIYIYIYLHSPTSHIVQCIQCSLCSLFFTLQQNTSAYSMSGNRLCVDAQDEPWSKWVKWLHKAEVRQKTYLQLHKKTIIYWVSICMLNQCSISRVYMAMDIAS